VQKRNRYGDPNRINLLVDIEAKLKTGKGRGYEQWAKVFNLKQLARTLAYLNENSISDYDQSVEKSRQLMKEQQQIEQQIRSINEELREKRALRTHIINFAKSKNVYDTYRKSRYNQSFFNEHNTEIMLHRAAKDAFNNWNGKKLPSAKLLWAQIDKLQLSKSDLVMQLSPLKKETRDCMNALTNVDQMIKHNDNLTVIRNNHYSR
jgi:hypothetical protein